MSKPKKFLAGIIIVVIVLVGLKIMDSYDEGYGNGWDKARSEIQPKYAPLFESQKKEYEEKIAAKKASWEKKRASQTKAYKKKIADAEVEGRRKGRNAALSQKQESLENTAEQKANVGDWNAVLFDVKGE